MKQKTRKLRRDFEESPAVTWGGVRRGRQSPAPNRDCSSLEPAPVTSRDTDVRHGTRTGYSGDREKIPWQNPQEPHFTRAGRSWLQTCDCRRKRAVSCLISDERGCLHTPWQQLQGGMGGGGNRGRLVLQQAELQAVLGRHRATGSGSGSGKIWAQTARKLSSIRSRWHLCQLVKLNASCQLFSIVALWIHVGIKGAWSPQSALNKNRRCSSETCFIEHLLCAAG